MIVPATNFRDPNGSHPGIEVFLLSKGSVFLFVLVFGNKQILFSVLRATALSFVPIARIINLFELNLKSIFSL